MAGKWKFVFKVVGSVIAAMVYVGSLPAKITLLTGFYSFFVTHWHSLGFRTLVFAFLIPAPFVFEIIDYCRPKVRVNLMPSGKGRHDLVLRVTNKGRRGNFKATCEVVASRETCGVPLDRTVNLKWVGITVPQTTIVANDSESLLIASYEMESSETSWLRVWGLDGQEKKQLTAAAWTPMPRERLPEIDLKVSIFREGSVNPRICYYTLRPASCVGPLEMFVSGS